MNGFKTIALATVITGVYLTAAAPSAQAQVAVDIGVAPACPYGYYDVPPYSCAPYGYYGPEWFAGGVFVGAGPWFHGPHGFHGHVNNRYDVGHGYHGHIPDRGEAASRHGFGGFRGNEVRDGRGHVGGGERHR
jgi:hypothetical protein